MKLSTHRQYDTIEGAFGLISGELTQVRELIDKQFTFAADSTALTSLLDDFQTSGKMLRPALVLLSGRLCGKITEDHIHVAAIIEIIHNATLLHDDVIDEGQQRRGRSTINKLRGNESAVLLGDFLLSRVFDMCADQQPKITKVIAAAASQTCAGELNQIAQRQNWLLTEQDYIGLIADKTAALFSTCCLLGGLLAGAPQNELNSLSDFGNNTGIAFQIADDLIDIMGREVQTGKTLGSDAGKNDITLPVIHLLSSAGEPEKAVLKQKLSAVAQNESSRMALKQMLTSSGSLKYAQERALEFVEQAIACLTGFAECQAKAALISAAGFVADRSG